jgi:hypothetical protein
MILDLGDGKQIVANADLGKLWLQVCANRGSLGVELTPDQAMEAGLTLFHLGRRSKRQKASEKL